MGINSSSFQIGDEVRISIEDMDVIEQMQASHGGWNDEMKECMKGPCILIQAQLGDALITGPSGRIYRVNPELLTKYVLGEYKSGEKVTITRDKERMIQLQEGHGGWVDIMEVLLGETVEIVEKISNGDYKVKSKGKNWTLNPACFSATDNINAPNQFKKGDSVRISESLEESMRLQEGHGGWNILMAQFLGKIGVVDFILPTGDVKVKIGLFGLVYNPKLLTKVSSPKPIFKIGDKIRVIEDKSKVKELQKNHGEWVDSMQLFLGQNGKVKAIFPDGDLRVKIMGSEITINPECVKKEDSDSSSGVPDMIKMINEMSKMLDQNNSDDSNSSDKSDSEIATLLKPEEVHLFLAVKSGNVEQASTLIDLVGPNISKKKVYPLMVAVNEGYEKLVELLLNKGANINVKDSEGDTALHLAVMTNRVEICKVLVKKGANVNDQNDAELTPIMLAAVTGVQEILRILVTAAGVNLNIGDKNKDTALHLAIQKSRLDSVEILLEAGADIKTLNERKFSCFHSAALIGNEKILEAFLIKFGPPIVDLQKEDKFAAIHLASTNNHTGCLTLLIKYKADINIRNLQLQTPLHIAVSQKYLLCVKILVEAKAEINLKDKDGDTPLHVGIRTHNIKEIKSMGALLGMPGIFQLLEGIQGGSDDPEDIVMFLVQNGARLDLKNNKGQTAIMTCNDDVLKAKILSMKEVRGSEKILQVEHNIGPSDSVHREMNELKLKVQNLQDEKICKICWDGNTDCAFECGHVCCENCANNLYECHICRNPIDKIIKIFR